MRLEGTYTFAAPRQAVWDALMDPTVLAGALPGGEEFVRAGDNDYQAAMNVKVGPVQGRFVGKITLSDITPLEQYTMKVDGQGAPGYVAGEGQLLLEEVDGGTLLRYAGDVQVGGRIAGVGQRLIESTARSMTRQGLTALDQNIQARLAPAQAVNPASETTPAAPARAATAPLPAQQASVTDIAAQVAWDVARDMAADYIPPEKQERAVWFALGALAMLAFVVLVRLVQHRD